MAVSAKQVVAVTDMAPVAAKRKRRSPEGVPTYEPARALDAVTVLPQVRKS